MGANEKKKNEELFRTGDISIDYKWSLGKAGTKFFKELRDNKKIFGAKCERCARVFTPPRIFCENCFQETEFVELGTTGEILTYAFSYLSQDAKSYMDKPKILIHVKLDGTTDGGLLHLLDEVDLKDVEIGMRVEAVFAEKRQGDLFDIRYFKPI
ncbi:Zn-ribbon domain-containing OB-fold protein [bacterium]|jgi:uncharacterized OB-fold protein|nr:Zn-ribbon domain-containing OB-fold protein [bacterium]